MLHIDESFYLSLVSSGNIQKNQQNGLILYLLQAIYIRAGYWDIKSIIFLEEREKVIC